MGRHSAPDDDEEDGDVLVAAPDAEVETGRGRHARSEDAEDTEPVGPQETAPLAVLEPRPGPSETAADEAPAPRVGKGNQSTAADLELLRERSDVRARVIAAVVAPFVIYTIVMLLVGGWHLYLIWAWLPLVTAGVLAGSFLDAAHRKRDRDTSSAGD
jgi:hypothetical protein